LFDEGRFYEGKRGLLQLLRSTNEGDEINAILGYSIDEYGHAMTRKESLGMARLIDGAFYLESGGSRSPALLKLIIGGYNQVEVHSNPGAFQANYGMAIESYTSVWLDSCCAQGRYDPSKVDPVAITLDVLGLGLGFFGAAAPAKLARAARVAEGASYAVAGTSAARSLVVSEDPTGAVLAVGGALPYPPVSIPLSVAALWRDLWVGMQP